MYYFLSIIKQLQRNQKILTIIDAILIKYIISKIKFPFY